MRQTKITSKQRKEIAKLFNESDLPASEIAKHYGISAAYVYHLKTVFDHCAECETQYEEGYKAAMKEFDYEHVGTGSGAGC